VLPAAITDPLRVTPAESTPQSGSATTVAPAGGGSGLAARSQLPRAPKQ
jgi:hypothetical protein